jgi:hypothetical protein
MRTPSRSAFARRAVEALLGAAGAGLLWLAWRADWRWYELHATWCYCAQYGRQVVLWRVWRTVVALAGGALLLVTPALGRRAGRVAARELGTQAASIAGAILLSLGVCESVLQRGSAPRKHGDYFDADWESDPRLTWRPVASHVTDVRVGDRSVHFVTDGHGFRVRSPGDEVDLSLPSILSGGESVAAGFGLDYDETYAAMLAADHRVPVVNTAVSGYAYDQAYLRLSDALTAAARPLASLMLVLPMTLDRGMFPDRAHLVPGPDGTLALRPRTDGTLLGRSRLIPLLQNATGLHSDEAIVRARAVLGQAARDARAHGAFPLFVLLDWPTCLPDETGAPSIERTLFEGLELTHVRVHLADDAWDAVTRHPNAKGNRAIADAVGRVLVERGVVEAGAGAAAREM